MSGEVIVRSFELFVLCLAVIGTISSSAFLLLALIAAGRFHRNAGRQAAAAESIPSLPAVSILKPVHGLEARLKENVESFFRQNYPDYEILFAADEESDEALPVVREVCARYPAIRSRVLVTGTPPWPSPPSYSFAKMAEAAENEILVTSDSDVEVGPDYLRAVVPPLLDPQVGMSTCLYRGKSAGGFWSALDAIGMSVEMTAGALVANLMEGLKFGLGPTIVLRKDSVAKAGGYREIANYFSNDFVTGNLIWKAGYQLVLSSYVIDHVVPPVSWRKLWERQLRWATGTRYSRPMGHLGTALVFATPYGLLGLIAASLLGWWQVGAALLSVAIVNRLIEALVIGWGVVRDPQARRAPWMFLIRDFLGFVLWVASYFGRKPVWRDKRYEILEGGRIVMRGEPVGEGKS